MYQSLTRAQIALLAIQYKNLHIYEQTVKSFVYSVKLKLEFSILGKLVDIVQESKRSLTNALGDIEDCIDQHKLSPDLHRTISPLSKPEHIVVAEKTSSQHLEHRDDGSSDTVPTRQGLAHGSMSEPERSYSNDSISNKARRRGARETEIEYAEIVRSIS